MPVRMMIVVDPERCTGCRMCEMACSLYHEGVCSPSLSRIRVYGRHTHREELHIPVVCMHCADPTCVAVCPMTAFRESDAAGCVVSGEPCIGCRLCFLTCPVGAIPFSPPPNAHALKCDLCGGDPQCVRFCQTQVLVYVPVTRAHQVKARKLLDYYASRLGGAPGQETGSAGDQVTV
jgi:Fe-S-cluster-containing hydrogenase component 2